MHLDLNLIHRSKLDHRPDGSVQFELLHADAPIGRVTTRKRSYKLEAEEPIRSSLEIAVTQLLAAQNAMHQVLEALADGLRDVPSAMLVCTRPEEPDPIVPGDWLCHWPEHSNEVVRGIALGGEDLTWTLKQAGRAAGRPDGHEWRAWRPWIDRLRPTRQALSAGATVIAWHPEEGVIEGQVIELRDNVLLRPVDGEPVKVETHQAWLRDDPGAPPWVNRMRLGLTDYRPDPVTWLRRTTMGLSL